MSNLLFEKFWVNMLKRPEHPRHFAITYILPDGQTFGFRKPHVAFGTLAIMTMLLRLGLRKGDRVCILAGNEPSWLMADFAIQSLGGVVVPIGLESSVQDAAYVLKDADAVIAIAGNAKLAALLEEASALNGGLVAPKILDVDSIPHELLTLPWAGDFTSWVANDCGPETPLDFWRLREARIIAERIAGGEFNRDEAADALATIVYTSGSSADPKGCMHTHGGIAAKMEAMSSSDVDLRVSSEGDYGIIYLALRHIFDRIDNMAMMVWNDVPFAFSTVPTMSRDVQKVHPTILLGVPAVWDKIYGACQNPHDRLPQLLNKLGLWKHLLSLAIASKKDSRAGNFWDKIILNKIAQKLGGNVRLAVSGGGAARAEVLTFLRRLGIEIVEGYGATETLSGVVTNRPWWVHMDGPRNKVGSVGLPLPGIEVKVVAPAGMDAEDIADLPSGVGELLIRGRILSTGYWKKPEATAEAFVDGWYRTGDLGHIDEDGFIYIDGRIGDIVKNQGGKFVNLEKAGNAMKAPIVLYAVAEALKRPFTTALVWIDVVEAKRLVARAVPDGVDEYAWLCQQPEVIAAVEAVRVKANSGETLSHYEKVQYFHIVPIAPTEANKIITESKKIRAKVLRKRFAPELDALYANARKAKVG